MKNIELLELRLRLNQVNFNDIKDGIFQYKISKNRSILKSECKIIEDAIEAVKPDDLLKMQAEFRPLVDKAIEEKSLKVGNNLTNNDLRLIENTILRDSGRFDEYNKLLEDFRELSKSIEEKDSDVKLRTLNYTSIKNLPLNDTQMMAIFPLIVDDLDSD